MQGRQAAMKSHLHAALRFHNGRPMIFSTIANKVFVQINDSLEEPLFQEITDEIEYCLSCDDWEAWEGSAPN
jgi:hypothetical protein